jgi:hypothetical protein
MATREIHSETAMEPTDLGRFDGNPLDAMDRSYADQLALCDELEEIADSLPDNVDRQKSIHAARSLWPLIRGSHSFEENIFFPMIRERLSDVENLDETIKRLRQEHTADECYAEELTDSLFRLGAGDRTLNAETLGYMLRGFFESLKRHIAFEREHILQIAKSSGRFRDVDGTRH